LPDHDESISQRSRSWVSNYVVHVSVVTHELRPEAGLVAIDIERRASEMLQWLAASTLLS
jgi:hypothetical protein